MSEGFNTLTINVRGTIKNIEERGKLLACVQLNNINILFLQETHVNDLKFKFQIDKIFNCQSYWSFGTSDSRGVAILLMNNFSKTVHKFEKDTEGRIVSVKISSNFGDLNIVNIYAPNEVSERKRFFRNIDPFFIGTNPILAAGDFNMVENLIMDKENGNPERGNEGVTELKSIKDSYDLTDSFRHLYKNERTYTWFCNHSGVKTRLDRLYVSKALTKNLIRVSNIHCNVSDHLGVKAVFNPI